MSPALEARIASAMRVVERYREDLYRTAGTDPREPVKTALRRVRYEDRTPFLRAEAHLRGLRRQVRG